jgi:hypothetical protein
MAILFNCINLSDCIIFFCINKALILLRFQKQYPYAQKFPPLFPALEINPLAFVDSIHLLGESVNELPPASKRKGSNSIPFEIEVIKLFP